jgi:hypothetical protein
MQRVEEFGSIGLSYLCGERERVRETDRPVKPSIQRDDDKQNNPDTCDYGWSAKERKLVIRYMSNDFSLLPSVVRNNNCRLQPVTNKEKMKKKVIKCSYSELLKS